MQPVILNKSVKSTTNPCF